MTGLSNGAEIPDVTPADTFGNIFGSAIPSSHDEMRIFAFEDWQMTTAPTTQKAKPTPLVARYESDVAEALKFFEAQIDGRRGLVDKFVCGTKLERQQAVRQISRPRRGTQDDHISPSSALSMPRDEHDAWAAWVLCIDVMVNDEAYYPLGDSLQPENPLIDDPVFESKPIDDQMDENLDDDIDEPLAGRTQEIVARLQEVTYYRPRNSIVKQQWSPDLEEQCREFFSPSNLRRCLMMYWLFWYPNSSIIHRPSFDPTTAAVTLLLSLVLTGASVSPDEQDREDSKMWLNLAEEVVFGDEWLFEGTVAPMADPAQLDVGWRRLEALQAALSICVLQSYEGTDESWRRIRRHRFTFVAAVSLATLHAL